MPSPPAGPTRTQRALYPERSRRPSSSIEQRLLRRRPSARYCAQWPPTRARQRPSRRWNCLRSPLFALASFARPSGRSSISMAAIWSIPAEKMKMRRPHLVPLSPRAVEVLRDLHAITGKGQFLFPSVRSVKRCMSENTINAALRRLGFKTDEMTAHGFRSAASSILNESGLWNPDAIERQLAHVDNGQRSPRLCARRLLGRACENDELVGGEMRRAQTRRRHSSIAGLTVNRPCPSKTPSRASPP